MIYLLMIKILIVMNILIDYLILIKLIHKNLIMNILYGTFVEKTNSNK